jgi:hypothetical protein
MRHVVKGRKIELSSGRTATFNYPIKEIVETEDAIVVRLDVPINRQLNENVYAIDHKGRLLWQIAPFERLLKNSAYVGISRVDNLVRAFNFDGLVYDLEPKTGEVVGKYFGK